MHSKPISAGIRFLEELNLFVSVNKKTLNDFLINLYYIGAPAKLI